ncbi:MAG: hypothetical protein PVSMB4_03780 [Ktedonobacterales bacterium]
MSNTPQPEPGTGPQLPYQDARNAAARGQLFNMISALVLLPLFLGGVAWLGTAAHLRFLLYPPLAAIGYALFQDPHGQRTSLRDGVLGPVVGGLVGVAALTWIPGGPWRVMVATAAGILVLRLLRIGLTSALAVTLLTLLVGGEGIAYVISIFASSLALAIIFRLWRRFMYSRVFPDAHSGWPSSPA